jgi:hypothetical protein
MEYILVILKKRIQQTYVPVYSPVLPCDDFVPVPQGDDSQNFAGCAAADRRIVLEQTNLLENLSVLGSQPTNPQSGQPKCLG